jgi:hypothetical protein
MRTGLLAAALAVLLAPAAAPAADPPVVYQTQPIGRLLDDARAAVQIIAGEQAVKSFNDSIKSTLGEKGFDGLDITRPVVGYVDVPADPKDTVAVLALPVTGEKEFLDFCERWNKSKPKALKDGLYEVPALNPGLKAVVRVADGYAFIATGVAAPERALGKDLVPVAKLFDPLDTAHATGRVYFDRFPKELRDKAIEGLNQLKKELTAQLGNLGVAEKAILGPLFEMATRYIDLSKGAKEAVLRLTLDPGTGEVAAEFALTAAPGSPLDKVIAARKPTTNKFAGLLTPDAVAGFKTRLPFFNDEIRTASVEGLEELRKAAGNNLPAQPKALVDELLKGAIRTVKTGEFDIAVVMRGPDKNGVFTAVGAIAFEDPSGVEKEAKKLIEASAPQDFRDALKWDAEKVGGVSIHTLDISKMPGGGGREIKQLFGENATVAVAFAPKAVYAAIGPGDEAVKEVKAAMALKPVESPVLDVVLNPARLIKMIQAAGGDQAAGEVAKALGTDDKQFSALSLSVAGGQELKVKFGINLKLMGRIGIGGARSAPVPAPVPPPK